LGILKAKLSKSPSHAIAGATIPIRREQHFERLGKIQNHFSKKFSCSTASACEPACQVKVVEASDEPAAVRRCQHSKPRPGLIDI